MAHFFGRLFKKNTRKGSPSPAYFEALESRQLLSATYAPKDLSGTWAILNHSSTAITGTLTIDNTGAVDAASVVKVGGTTLANTDLVFTVNVDGTVTLESTKVGATFDLTLGRVNSNKSLVSLDDAATGDTTLLVKKDATITADELKGTWSYSGEDINGTFVIGKNAAGKPVFTSASVKVNGVAVAIDKANSTIDITTTPGTITINLKDFKGGTITLTGVKVDSTQGDVLAFVNGAGKISMAIKQGVASGFAANDLAAGGSSATWFATGSEGNGSLAIASPDSKGNSAVSGTLDIKTGGVVAAVSTTGSLKINSKGEITGTLTINPNTWLASTITVTGRMNLSKNFLELHSADGSFFVTLTTSADHATTVANSGKPVSIDGATNVTGGKGVTITYAQILTAMGLTDIDGDSQDTLTLVLKSGSLKVNGADKTGTVTLNKGDSLEWFTDSTMGAGAKVIGFTVKVPTALDAAATSIRFVHVANPVTLTTPVATATATTDAKVVVTRTNTKDSQPIIINLSGLTSGTDYSLALASTDTGKATFVVDASGNFATLTLNDKVASVTILVHKMTVADTGNRIVTLSLASVSASAGFEVGATKNAVDITVAGTHSASAGGISITTAPSSIIEGATGTFVITSTKAPATDQSIDVTVSGITSRYTLEYSSDGKTNWTPTILTGDATTVKLATGKLKVYVRMTIIDDSTPQGDKSASLAISLSTNKDKFYVNEATSMVDFTAKDNEQQVTVKASAPTVNEGKSDTFTISVPTAVTADTTLTFKLSGTALLTDNQYTISGASYNVGTDTYTVTIHKGFKSAVVTLAATADTKRTETDQTVILTMQSGAYILPSSPTTITIKNVATDVAPTLTVTSAKLTGDFVEGSTTGTSVTVASLIAAAKATDLENGTTLSIKITNIATGVTLKVDGTALAVGDAVASDKTIVVYIGSTVAATSSKALFSGKFQDGEGALTTKTFSATGNVPANAAPTMANDAASLSVTAPSTAKTITFQDLVDATGASDANNDTLTFTVTNITGTGLKLTDVNGAALAEGTLITSTTVIYWAGSATAGVANLFSVSVKDATHTTSTKKVIVSTTVNAAPTLNATGSLGSVAPSTTKTFNFTDLKTASGATDAENDTLTFKVSAIAGTGLKLTDASGAALTVGTVITSTTVIYWAGTATTGATPLFSVIVLDTLHPDLTSACALSITVA